MKIMILSYDYMKSIEVMLKKDQFSRQTLHI